MSKSRPMRDNPNDMTNEEVSSIFNFVCLPAEMREEVLSHCSPQALGMFAKTSRQAEANTAFFEVRPRSW